MNSVCSYGCDGIVIDIAIANNHSMLRRQSYQVGNDHRCHLCDKVLFPFSNDFMRQFSKTLHAVLFNKITAHIWLVDGVSILHMPITAIVSSVNIITVFLLKLICNCGFASAPNEIYIVLLCCLRYAWLLLYALRNTIRHVVNS